MHPGSSPGEALAACAPALAARRSPPASRVGARARGGRPALRALRGVRLHLRAAERPARPQRRRARARVAAREARARPAPRRRHAAAARSCWRAAPGSRPPRRSRATTLGAALRRPTAPRPDRLRPARHRALGPAALPAARAREPARGGRRGGRVRRAAWAGGAPSTRAATRSTDIEAIRAELGAERIALFGTSYGTKVALGYALRHPSHVERLVLDSVVEASGPDPFYLDTIEAVPRALRALCRPALPVDERSGGRPRPARRADLAPRAAARARDRRARAAGARGGSRGWTCSRS